jgi:hypothetical protein
VVKGHQALLSEQAYNERPSSQKDISPYQQISSQRVAVILNESPWAKIMTTLLNSPYQRAIFELEFRQTGNRWCDCPYMGSTRRLCTIYGPSVVSRNQFGLHRAHLSKHEFEGNMFFATYVGGKPALINPKPELLREAIKRRSIPIEEVTQFSPKLGA